MRSLLPEHMQDKSNLAIEQCMNEAFNIDLKPFMTCLIDYCSEEVLYALAERFSLIGDGYETSANIEEKRKLIKNAYKIHKLKATVKCIKNLLSENITFMSWQEYNGIHNHYKLRVNYYDTAVNRQIIFNLLRKIELNKRLSAKQDGYEIVNAIYTPLCITSRFKTEIIAKCLPLEEII